MWRKAMSVKRSNLFDPIHIGGLQVRNRIVLSPMGIGAYNDDETVSDDYVSFVKARAEETGLIVTTGARVSSKYSAFTFLGCYDNAQIPGYRELVRAAHEKGARIFLQILELGGADPDMPFVPSADIPVYREEWQGETKPVELSAEQIGEIIESFVIAAARAQEAGFDGVELGAAENFLLSDFICPAMNHREDEYGGCFENRMRFPTEILRGIRRRCGEDFPVGFKFNAFHDLPDGIDLDLGARIAGHMAGQGAAYIHEWSFAKPDRPMSLWLYPPMPNLYQPRNTTVEIARYLKSRLNGIPVIAVGGILKPDEADRIIGEGRADMVAVGRGFIADHLWAFNAKRSKSPRPCIRCHVCHHEVAVLGNIVSCSVNPDVLCKRPLHKTDAPEHVMVAGAGPGGLTAALTASARGHRVHLYEAGGEVGGKLIPGSAPDFKHEFRDLLLYLQDAVKESEITLHFNCRVTPGLVESMKPDTLVLATGSVPYVPDIRGIAEHPFLHATEALMQAHRIERKKIAVIGGGDVGCETALLLQRNGNEVTIVEALASLMETEEIEHNTVVLEAMLREAGVRVMTGTVVRERREGVLSLEESAASAASSLQTDLAVLCTGYRATPGNVDEFRNLCGRIYAIGDCVEPGRLRQAIGEGYRIGLLI
jgi:2-enoate reductase